ncbi:hypothetical protein [Mesobacillus harenae]|uniref:hypothetical protein n=1 Tax=Mesobacillus harenae TaxID=2213203 RepID=UPI0015803FBB|nr:hypothetical protein [Mesobacillus harenae]
MLCVCEELTIEMLSKTYKVAIIETKPQILKLYGVPSRLWLSLYSIDTRILTFISQSTVPSYDYYIHIYDYSHFNSEKDIKLAIILHELAHIKYPDSAENDLADTEISCDMFVADKGYQVGLAKVLWMIDHLAESLSNEQLKDITIKRITSLNSILDHAG